MRDFVFHAPGSCHGMKFTSFFFFSAIFFHQTPPLDNYVNCEALIELLIGQLKKLCQKCGKKHPPHVHCKCKLKKDSDDIFLCAFGDKKKTVSSSSHCTTCQLILDSGCSCYIVGKKLFSNLFDIHEVSPCIINLVDVKTYTSNCAGTLIVQPVKGGKTLHITDVTYVPEINDCFISISQLAKKNLISIFKSNICQIRSKNDVLITVKHMGGLYCVETFITSLKTAKPAPPR